MLGLMQGFIGDLNDAGPLMHGFLYGWKDAEPNAGFPFWLEGCA
jgi:hypothetical protein